MQKSLLLSGESFMDFFIYKRKQKNTLKKIIGRIALSLFLCCITISAISGNMYIVNGTQNDWIRTEYKGYQVNSDFPAKIEAGTSVWISIDFDEDSFWDPVNTSHTRGNVFYTFENTNDGINIKTPYKNISVDLYENGPITISETPGYREDGVMFFILSESDGRYYSRASYVDDWMQETLPTIGEKKLIDICIPGSHDAGMSNVKEGIGNSTLGAHPCNTQTQLYSIGKQLKFGTRYFDLRPVISQGKFKAGHYSDTGTILGYQGANGENLDAIIDSINIFTSKHNELIILNISHTLNTDSGYEELNEDEFYWLFTELSKLNHLYSNENLEKKLYNLKVNEFIGDNNPCVLIVVENSILKDDERIKSEFYKKGFFVEDESFNTYNKYSNKNNSGEMAWDQTQKLKDHIGQYFLLSWTLTQDAEDAVLCNDRPLDWVNDIYQIYSVGSILHYANEANETLPSIMYPIMPFSDVPLTPLINSETYPNIIYTDRIENSNSTLISIYINSISQTKGCNLPPVAISKDKTVFLDSSGNAEITADDVDGGSYDLCGIHEREISRTSFDISDLGMVENTALQFDGIDDYVEVLKPVVPTSGDFSVMFWVKSFPDNDIYYEVLSQTGSTVISNMSNFYIGRNNEGMISVNDNWENTGVAFPEDGNWHHIAVVKTNLSTLLYVDGEKKAERNEGINNPIGNSFRLGRHWGNYDGYMKGCIDEVSVWGSAKTSSEINQLMINPPIGTEPDLRAYYNMEGFDGSTVLPDLSGNLNDGVLMNMNKAWIVSPIEGYIQPLTVALSVTDDQGNRSSGVSVITLLDTISPIAKCQDKTIFLDKDGTASLTVEEIDYGSTDIAGIAEKQLSKTTFDCGDLTSFSNTALQFDGVDDYVNVDKAVIPTSGDFTVMVWSKSTPGQTAYREIISQIGSKGSFFIGKNSDGTIRITDDWLHTGLVFPQDGEWHNFAVVKTSANTLLYIDGELKAEKGSAIDNPTGSTFRIARQYGQWKEYMNGDIDEISVWNTAKDIVAIKQLLTQSPTGTESDLVAYYNMESFSGSKILPDVSGNGKDGTLMNMDASNAWVVSPIENYLQPQAVILTVTDNNGNSSSCQALVEVLDTISPIAVCQTDTMDVFLDEFGMNSILANDIDAGSTDNCAFQNITVNKTNFTCSDVGYNAIALTAFDKAGNTSTCNAVANVIDKIKPTVVTQNITIQLDRYGRADIDPVDIDNGSSDNCAVASRELDISAFDCSDVGTNTVTLTITDVNGNVASNTAIVTVEDKLDPMVVTQNITIQLDENGVVNIIPDNIDNGSSDNCAIATRELDISAFDCSDVGVNTVILTITDVNGNVASNTAVVTVEDKLGPMVVTQNITIQLDENGVVNIIPDNIDNGSSDNCAIASRELDISAFDCSDVGVNTVILTITDVNGNVASNTAVVTVEDKIDPTVVTQNITIQLDENGNAAIVPSDIDSGSSDNCDIVEMMLDKNTFDKNNIGNNLVELTVSDASGNIARQTAIVSIEDGIAPNAICNDQDIYLKDNGTYNLSSKEARAFAEGTSDNAAGFDELDIVLSRTEFNCTDIGKDIMEKVKVTDPSGNEANCWAKVNVHTPANYVVPQVEDIEVLTEAGKCSSVVDYPNFYENGCATFILKEGLGAGAEFPVGTTTELWLLVRSAGDTTGISFDVTVLAENGLPAVDAIANVETTEDADIMVDLTGISSGADCEEQTIEIEAIGINTDVVENIEVVYSSPDSTGMLKPEFVENASGTSEVEVTVTDSEGGEVTSIFEITVLPENDPPFVVLPLPDETVNAAYEIEIPVSSVVGELFDDVDDDELEVNISLVGVDTIPSWAVFEDEVLFARPELGDMGSYDFVVTATDTSMATATDTFMLVVEGYPTSVDDMSGSRFEVGLFPNPSKDVVNITLNVVRQADVELRVTNVSGSEVFRKTYKQEETLQFDMSDHVSGVYMVMIKMNEREVVKKLILDRQ